MKNIFCFILCFSICFNFGYGTFYDSYSRRLSIRNSTYSTLFTKINGENKLAKEVKDSGVTECQNDMYNLLNSLSPSFISASSMSNLYASLEKCPSFYSSFKYRNISTWGSFSEFLYLYNTAILDTIWPEIDNIEENGKCKFFNDMIEWLTNDGKICVRDFLNDNYDDGLCTNDEQTMYKWHKLLENPIFTSLDTNTKFFLRTYQGLSPISIGLTKIIAKMYLNQNRYDDYFIKSSSSQEYPLITYFNATLALPSYTLTQKGFIKQQINYFKQQFPLYDVEGRKNLVQSKFCESIDLTYSYFRLLSQISLNFEDEISHFDLILFLAQKGFLNFKRLFYCHPRTTKKPTTTTTKATTTTPKTTTKPPTTTTTAKTTTKPPTTTTPKATTTVPTTTTSKATTVATKTSTTISTFNPTSSTPAMTTTTTCYVTTTVTSIAPTTTPSTTTSTTPSTTTPAPTTPSTTTPSTTTPSTTTSTTPSTTTPSTTTPSTTTPSTTTPAPTTPSTTTPAPTFPTTTTATATCPFNPNLAGIILLSNDIVIEEGVEFGVAPTVTQTTLPPPATGGCGPNQGNCVYFATATCTTPDTILIVNGQDVLAIPATLNCGPNGRYQYFSDGLGRMEDVRTFVCG